MSIIPIAIGTVDASSITSGTIDAARMYAYSGVFSGLPSATLYPAGTKSWVTDVGNTGSEYVSDGADWTPVNGSTRLCQLKLPVFIAPTFTGTTNGAITLGTALNIRQPKCYMYFGANKLNASQPAGFYYVEMSSTTAAVAYNNTYTPAAGVDSTEPVSKVAFSGAVPGGAGETGEVTAHITSVNGGLLGLYGVLETNFLPTWASTGGNKTFRIKLGSTTFATGIGTTSSGTRGSVRIQNNGSQNVNIGDNSMFVLSNFGTLGSVDTSADTTLSLTMQLATATDFCGMSSYTVMLRK